MATEVINGGGTVQHLEQYFIAKPPVITQSRSQVTSNGSQVQFTIPFPYIDPLHVNVLVGGVKIASPAWSFVDPVTIQLSVAQTAGILVEVRRVTPSNPLVTYNDGAILTGEDLNLATLQNLYLIQEWQDLYGAALGGALTQVAGYQGPVTVSPAEMIAAVADQVLNSSLAVALNQRINDIDLNATAILNNAIAVDNINAIIASLTGVGGVATIIATETASRISGDSALQTQLTLLGALNGAHTAFILDTNHAYVDATTSLATRLTGLDAFDSTNAAAITTESTARVSGDNSLASLITTLTSTVAGNTASIATNATVVSGLSAQYTVKVDVNGHVAGFGLASLPINGAVVSSFIVQANDFAIVDPGNGLSSPTVPFAVSGGVVFMNSVVINGALIQNATITNAQIANLTLGTAQMAANAITSISTGVSAAVVSNGGSGFGPVHDLDIITVTVTTTGAQVEIDVGSMVQYASGPSASMPTCNLQVYRDGNPVPGMKFDPTFGGAVSIGTSVVTTQVTLTVLDTPGAGSHTYALHSQVQKSGTSGSVFLSCSNNFIKVMEIKK